MTRPGHVLFLTHEPPMPPVSGTRLRSLGLMRELHRRGWKVSLFALASPEDSGRDPGLDEIYERAVVVELERSRPRLLARAVGGMVRRRPLPEWFFASRRARDELRASFQLGDFDALMVEGLWMYPYVPRGAYPRAVLDCHNVEAARIARMADVLKGSAKGLLARRQAASIRSYELAAAASAGGCLAASEADAALLSEAPGARVAVVPNGVDFARYEPLPLAEGSGLLFIGALDYGANTDAVRHFAASIQPRVRSEEHLLTVVGRGEDRLAQVRGQTGGLINFAGQVESTLPYLQAARVFVVPIRFGGGTRLKILEAMAAGVPVVSTSVGCEGLEVRHDHDILVADEPEAFARCIDRLAADPELQRRLAANARETVRSRYDWPRIGEALERALTLIVEGRTQ